MFLFGLSPVGLKLYPIDFGAGHVFLHITVSGKHTLYQVQLYFSHAQDTEGVNGTVKWLLK
jgi:hypothetical protein